MIYLLEDDKSIVENLSEFLCGEGFLVESAAGQSSALELLQKEEFDLVLLDISLSDGNGFAVCSANLPTARASVSSTRHTTPTLRCLSATVLQSSKSSICTT